MTETNKTSQPQPLPSMPSNIKPPNSKSTYLFFILLILITSAIATFIWNSQKTPISEVTSNIENKNTAGIVKFLMEQQWLIHMKLAKVEQQPLARQVAAVGRVIPTSSSRAIVAPSVSGILGEGRLPTIGQEVKQGQTLAVLRQTPTAVDTAQLATSNAQLKLENMRLEAEKRRLAQAIIEAQARVDQTKAEYERSQNLYEAKVLPLRQLQLAEANYKASQATLESAISQKKVFDDSSQMISQEVLTQPNYIITAPISGTIVAVHKTIGEQVNIGEAVFEIIDLDTVWVEAPIFESDLPKLEKLSQAIFTTTANPAKEYTGKLVNIGAVVDEKSRTATVTFAVPNPDKALKIGMQANVRLDASDTIDAMVIPRESILDHEGKKIVYVLLSGEEFQRREVTLGDGYGDKVAILSGLQAGERVVTQGAYQLKLQELRPADAGAHTHET
ncbi:MAG: RND family efflux transporter MFP subunit [bacterium]|nr:MAG: RND family efflux transporter MFP subunit [bacterium]